MRGHHNILLLTLFFGLLVCWTGSGCRKDKFLLDPSATLEFSTDTVLFDTVFTSIGSATRQLRVYNPHKEKLLISEVRLAGGTASPFRINVDGIPGPSVTDIEIPGGDSIFIFVEVTVDPNNSNSPMVVNDSLLFSLNGKLQDVDLVAWGQDVHYINSLLFCNDTWIDDKPYLIYNSVGIDTGCVLTIKEGCRLYFHGNSALVVWGKLNVEGTPEKPVTMQGDRLEEYYSDIAGQWFGIYIDGGSSTGNIIRGTTIRNSIFGVYVDSISQPGVVAEISDCRINNVEFSGIRAINTIVRGKNLLITNCGESCLQTAGAGDNEFINCTFANYYTAQRESSAVQIFSHYTLNKVVYAGYQKCNIRNSIITGRLENEFTANSEYGTMDYSVDHSLVKTNKPLWGSNNILNADPGFKDASKGDFTPSATSPAVDMGDPSVLSDPALIRDLANKPRDASPDAGALEYIP